MTRMVEIYLGGKQVAALLGLPEEAYVDRIEVMRGEMGAISLRVVGIGPERAPGDEIPNWRSPAVAYGRIEWDSVGIDPWA